jgi:protein-tyrosine phosphatase
MGNAIDFHSHILPGADHGSDSVSTSLAQLSLLRKAGVGTVVATPHFYPNADTVSTFTERRRRTFAALAERVGGGMPRVLAGAEVLVCHGIDRMEGIDRLCVYGTKCILLEMPMTDWDEEMYDTVQRVKKKGLDVVMAHADRYGTDQVERMLDMGIPAQINASSLVNVFRRRRIMRWIEDGYIVALGSDIHGANKKLASDYADAMKILGSYGDDIMRCTERLLYNAKTIIPSK